MDLKNQVDFIASGSRSGFGLFLSLSGVGISKSL
jgi:hypothetical protein